MGRGRELRAGSGLHALGWALCAQWQGNEPLLGRAAPGHPVCTPWLRVYENRGCAKVGIVGVRVMQCVSKLKPKC